MFPGNKHVVVVLIIRPFQQVPLSRRSHHPSFVLRGVCGAGTDNASKPEGEPTYLAERGICTVTNEARVVLLLAVTPTFRGARIS